MQSSSPAAASTFPQQLLERARERADQPALREKRRGIWQTTTWKQWADDAAALAAALDADGLQRGQQVLFLSDNRPRLYIAMAASQWLGSVLVPLYQDAGVDELVQIITSGQIACAFVEDQEQVDKLLEALPNCPSLRRIVYDQDRGMRHYRQPQLESYAHLLERGRGLQPSNQPALDALLAGGRAGDDAAVFFTSGASAAAKGVVFTHAALGERCGVIAGMERLGAGDVTLAYLSPGWLGQHLMSYALALTSGVTICCPESSETMLSDLREVGPTLFLAPPRVLEALVTQVTLRMQDSGRFKREMFERAMKLADSVGERVRAGQPVSGGERLRLSLAERTMYGPLRDVLGMSRVRVAYAAGEAMAPQLLHFFRNIGINLKPMYGSVETGVFLCAQRDDDVRADTVGQPLGGAELKVSPSREILVRSSSLFRAYVGSTSASNSAIDADGWFRTGDAGEIDADGHVRIIDRLEDLGTLSNGTLFAPKQVENRLKLSPYVADAVVFGQGRDRVCALLVLDLNATGNWADKRNISYTGFADLASRPEVAALVGEAVAQVNADLARDPATTGTQVHRFLLLPKPLESGDGELTRTRKVRRAFVQERYRPLVDALYDGSTRARIDTHIAYGDGSSIHLAADVSLHDAKVQGAGASASKSASSGPRSTPAPQQAA